MMTWIDHVREVWEINLYLLHLRRNMHIKHLLVKYFLISKYSVMLLYDSKFSIELVKDSDDSNNDNKLLILNL